MQSPSLQLFNKVFDLGRNYGYTVIDYKDIAQEVQYPFLTVEMPDETVNNYTFSSLNGDASVRLKVFSLANDRGAHDEITHTLKMELAKLSQLNDYTLILNDVQVNTMIYTESNQELLQTNILAEYKTY